MILWNNGAPLSGVDETNSAEGTIFWHNGTPYGYIYEATITDIIKSISGILWTGIKKIGGITIANLKKIGGVSKN